MEQVVGQKAEQEEGHIEDHAQEVQEQNNTNWEDQWERYWDDMREKSDPATVRLVVVPHRDKLLLYSVGPQPLRLPQLTNSALVQGQPQGLRPYELYS